MAINKQANTNNFGNPNGSRHNFPVKNPMPITDDVFQERGRAQRERNKAKKELRRMEEQAKEELKILEAQYPNQFEHLKLELRAFISQLQSKHQDSHLLPENNNCSTFLAFHDTQESTSLEQRKRSNYGLELALADKVVMEGKIDVGSELESPRTVVMKHYTSRKNKRKDRVDLVLERAQACLKKIRHLKTSLLSPS